MKPNRSAAVAWICVLAWALVPGSAVAFDVKPREGTVLDAKEFFRPELHVSMSNVPAAEILERLPNRPAWDRLLESADEPPTVYFDPRSGTPTSIITSIPLIPGTGNRLTIDDVRGTLGRRFESIDSKVVGELITKFVVRNQEALAIDPAQLGPVRARQITRDLWNVRIPQVVGGIPVRFGQLVATISHGNLTLFGTEMWGKPSVDTQPRITADQALDAGFAYVGGKAAEDEIIRKPSLEILPYAPPRYQEGDRYAGPVGAGYGYYLVWVFGFREKNALANWEVLVDAGTGEVIQLEDTNLYDTQQVQGGVYPLTNTGICPTNDTCGTMQANQPMPYANTGLAAPNDFTNSAGLFDFTSGTVATSLNGKFVRISDACGPINESSAAGAVDLGGTNGQHDCATSGTSPGDTPASRSAFYEVNKLVEVAKGWLPFNSWLNTPITANMNINQTCNAFYSAASGDINFYRSGGGCRNSGEIAAIFDHEWGHALDDNDSGGALSSSSEAYADVASIYRLRASCAGYGFFSTLNHGCGATADGTGFNTNESLTDIECAINCSGARECDWAQHVSNAPSVAPAWGCTHCSAGSGPCGLQVHCSAAPSRQAAWDLAARDLQAAPFHMTRDDAFNLSSKLFFQGSGNIASWHACTCGGTADGCGATNAYMQWLAADDDDGNLANGTPHLTAIYAAFNRHGIACAAPVPANSGCAGGPTLAPNVTAIAGNNQITLNWGAVPNASTYRVLRTEGYAQCDFGKAVIGEVAATTFVDTSAANGRPYYYVVQAVGASGSCMGAGSDCLTAIPQPCAGAVSAGGAVYNCGSLVALSLVDSDLAGMGTHAVSVSSTAETTPEAVALNESPAGSGKFFGTIQATPAAPAADGLISVADGGTITVRYVDASFCGAPDVTVDRTAAVDCSGPIITNVRAENITASAADLKWDTNEPSTSAVSYGTPPAPTITPAENTALVTAHTRRITGLTECGNYVFSVASTDGALNSSSADNGGAYYAFATAPLVNPTYASPDVPVPVPPVSATPNVAEIVVAEDKPLLDVNVRFNMTHGFDGDNVITLRHPDGTLVTLSNRRGSGGVNFIDTVFDDEAVTPIAGGAAPFTGSFIPDGPLSALDGKSSQGTWQLQVLDNISGDGGTLNGFELILTYPAYSCGPACEPAASSRLSDTCVSGSPGSGNGYWDDGERAVLQVTLHNNGSQDLTNVRATLTPAVPGITMLDATAAYPNLAPGASAVSTAPYFTARLDPGFACGAPVQFQVVIHSDQGTFHGSFSAGTAGNYFPGGTATALSTDFASGIPAGWTVVNGGTGGGAASTWTTANPGARAPVAPITNPFATVDSDSAGSGATQDEQLITPVLNLSAATTVSLEFDQYFRNYPLGGAEKGDVDVRSSLTGGAWVNLFRNDTVTSPNPEHKTLNVTAQAAGAADVQIRFHYYNATGDWYWMVDNVRVNYSASTSCSIAACAVLEPPPEVVDLRFDDRVTASWSSVPGAASYKLYRGADFELPKLFTAAADSCLRVTTPSLSASGLSDTPVPGSFIWWLVRAANSYGDGPAGSGTAGPRIHDPSGICP